METMQFYLKKCVFRLKSLQWKKFFSYHESHDQRLDVFTSGQDEEEEDVGG